MALRRSDDVVVRPLNSTNTSWPLDDLEYRTRVPGDGVEDVGEGSPDFARAPKFLDELMYPCEAEFVDVDVKRVAKHVAHAPGTPVSMMLVY